MLVKKFTLVALVAIISGCASNAALEANISQLNQKVDNLTEQVNSLASQTQAVSADVNQLGAAQEQTRETVIETKIAVEKANERIDNMVASYKK